MRRLCSIMQVWAFLGFHFGHRRVLPVHVYILERGAKMICSGLAIIQGQKPKHLQAEGSPRL